METTLFKFINNYYSLSSNKGNQNRTTVVCISEHRFYDFISLFSHCIALVLIEKTHQTLTRVFHHVTKHLEVHQK